MDSKLAKDGNLNLPMLGKVMVAGNSQSEIEQIIQKKADESLSDAIVKLNF